MIDLSGVISDDSFSFLDSSAGRNVKQKRRRQILIFALTWKG